MNCTPQELMALTAQAGYTSFGSNRLGQLIVEQYYNVAQDPTVVIPFDPALCAVAGVTTGGGDVFDCYPVEDLTTSYFTSKDAGTGWDGVWCFGVAGYGQQFGDTFASYPDGAAGTLSGGTGLTGDWRHD